MDRLKNINFHLLMKDTLKHVSGKPKMLLHVCCGPCFAIPYTYLKDYFDITIIYNNSNIYPYEEYKRRLGELKKYLGDIKADIDIIEPQYDNQKYNIDLEPYKDEKEGGNRCFICYEKRLKEAFEYASKNHCDYVCSVMSISRYKNALKLNEIGYKLEILFPNVKWLPCDFKKENGYEKELEICRKYNLYFQDYCGCKYSYKKRLEKLKNEG